MDYHLMSIGNILIRATITTLASPQHLTALLSTDSALLIDGIHIFE